MMEQRITVRMKNERERAREAMRLVREIEGKGGSGKYLSYVRGASSIIQTNGLAQSLAFWGSKNEEPYRWLIEHIAFFIMGEASNAEAVRDEILNMQPFQYRHATGEALAGLVWLSRFATAVLDKEEQQPELEDENEPEK